VKETRDSVQNGGSSRGHPWLCVKDSERGREAYGRHCKGGSEAVFSSDAHVWVSVQQSGRICFTSHGSGV
jgi:hypothetical protein